MRGDELHGGPVGTHETRIVGPEKVEVGAEGHGLQLEFAQSFGEGLEFICGRLEKESHLHPLETGGGDGLGFFRQIGRRITLEHHAQADVVLGRFLGKQA